MPEVEPPEPTGFGEVVWLEPYPDSLLEGAIDMLSSPEARYEQTDAISLAFVTALQVLPARQRAVLILREVLGYRANEVADMLDSTVDSVNNALKRARSSLQRRTEREPPPAPDSPSEQALVARFVRAYEAGDVAALIGLLTEDVRVSMPPVPFEYEGIDVVARFYASIFGGGRWAYDLVPTVRANRQVAFGAYVRVPTGTRHGAGLLVLTLAGDRICAMTRFDNSVSRDLDCHYRSPADNRYLCRSRSFPPVRRRRRLRRSPVCPASRCLSVHRLPDKTAVSNSKSCTIRPAYVAPERLRARERISVALSRSTGRRRFVETSEPDHRPSSGPM